MSNGKRGVANGFNRCAAFVNLGAVRRNAERVINMITPGCGLCAVVKADGYGHGAEGVSRACLGAGAKALGVATAQEGAALRAANLKTAAGEDAPIIILGVSLYGDIDLAIRNNLTLTTAGYENAAEIAARARHIGQTARIHFKTDTGMARIGLNTCEAFGELSRVVNLEGIILEGVFTHLADSDEPGGAYTARQSAEFSSFINKLNEGGIHVPWHIANSGAALAGRGTDGALVRSGIALYGLSQSAGRGFEPVMSLLARVVFVKNISAGQSVGYGRMFTAKRETKVATVSIGYGDGYPRLLSNKGEAVIAGKRAPVIGSVCMDQLMLDVTDIGEVKVGDAAALIGGGPAGGEYIGANELAEKIGTIPYEIVTGISARVPRIAVE